MAPTRTLYDTRRADGEVPTHWGDRHAGTTHTACGQFTSTDLPLAATPEQVTCLNCQRSRQLLPYRDRLPLAFVLKRTVTTRDAGTPRQLELRRLAWDSEDEDVVRHACQELVEDYGETCWHCSPSAAAHMLATSYTVQALFDARYEEVSDERDEERAQQLCGLISRRYGRECGWCTYLAELEAERP